MDNFVFIFLGFGQEAEIIEILSTSRQRLDTDKKEVSSQVFAKEVCLLNLPNDTNIGKPDSAMQVRIIKSSQIINF